MKDFTTHITRPGDGVLSLGRISYPVCTTWRPFVDLVSKFVSFDVQYCRLTAESVDILIQGYDHVSSATIRLHHGVLYFVSKAAIVRAAAMI